jgi:hypothetical protein
MKEVFLPIVFGILITWSTPALAQANCETSPDGRSFGPFDTIDFALTNYGRVIGNTEGSTVNGRSLPSTNGTVGATFRVGQEDLNVIGKGFDEQCRTWYQVYDSVTQKYWFVLSEFIQLTGNENGVYF